MQIKVLCVLVSAWLERQGPGSPLPVLVDGEGTT